MNRCTRGLLAPLTLASLISCLGAVQAAQPAAPDSGNGNTNGQDNGRWNQVFQGSGNVTQTRCLGMSRGPNCITAATRKEAARRAAAERAAAAGAPSTTAPANSGRGGNNS